MSIFFFLKVYFDYEENIHYCLKSGDTIMKKKYFRKIIVYADTAIILSEDIVAEKLVSSSIELLNHSTFSHCIKKLFSNAKYKEKIKEILNVTEINDRDIFIFKGQPAYGSRFIFDSLPFNQMDKFYDNSYPTPSLPIGNICFDSTYNGFFKEVYFSFSRDLRRIYLNINKQKVAQCNTRKKKEIKSFIDSCLPSILNVFRKEDKLYNEDEYNNYFINKYKSLLLNEFDISDIDIIVTKIIPHNKPEKFYLPRIDIHHKKINYSISYICNQHMSNRSDFSINHFLLNHEKDLKDMKKMQIIFEEQQNLKKNIKTKKAQLKTRL